MTMDALLARFDGVKQRGSRYLALCPAHADRSPSLQITEGDRGVLLKCWAGCSLDEICTALGITAAELFYESLSCDSEERKLAAQRRAAEQAARVHRAQIDGAMIDALREADYFIRSRSGLDISTWSPRQLDEELSALADAYALLACEGLDGH